MKKAIINSTVATALLMGSTGIVFAQDNGIDQTGHSAAMEDAYEANQEPLEPGSGVTADGMEKELFDGHSASTNESMDAVESETDEKTNIADAEELDELSAEGHSAEAAEAIESQ